MATRSRSTCQAVGVLQIDDQAALATVHARPQRADAADAVAEQPHAVAALGLFDLHDLGAEIGAEHRGHRARHHLAGLDDGEAAQRSRHGAAP